MKYLFSILASSYLLIACNGSQNIVSQINAETNNLNQLALIMPGEYSNIVQHEQDKENFYHITMNIYRIWEDRDDARWFYVEQAQAILPEKPYRQRIYRLQRGERDTLISHVLTLPNPENYIGATSQSKDLWENLTPEQLTERTGCGVLLTKKANGHYTGSTRLNTCASTLRGADFANSDVSIKYEEITSLDRGFDKEGKQIWGSEHGPYKFTRIEKKK